MDHLHSCHHPTHTACSCRRYWKSDPTQLVTIWHILSGITPVWAVIALMVGSVSKNVTVRVKTNEYANQSSIKISSIF